MSLFLDLWHVRQNLNFIETNQLNNAVLILHIEIAALTSHIASRSCRHIQLNCFGVSLPFMSCIAFLSLFVFRFMWVLSSWFQWALAVIFMYVRLYKHRFYSRLHLSVVTCMTLFCTDIRCYADSIHTHAWFPIFWILHLLFVWMIIHSCLHSPHHTSKLLMFSVAHRLVPCPVSIVHFWKQALYIPSRNCASIIQ